jgi:hypothetical protein
MEKTDINQYNSHRLSVRLSVTLWVALALCIWVTLGLVVRYASHWEGDSMEAEGHRLSTIVPAAGAPLPAAGFQEQKRAVAITK